MTFANTWVLGAIKEDITPFSHQALQPQNAIVSSNSHYEIDAQGFLVKNNANVVKGWSAKLDPFVKQPCHPYPLNILQIAHTHKMARATTKIELQQNLPISTPLGACPGQTTVMVYNHLGEQHALQLLWKKVAPFMWSIIPVCAGANNISRTSGEHVDHQPLMVVFSIEGAPVSFDGHEGHIHLNMEWRDGTVTPLCLDLGAPLELNGLTSRGDTLSYMAYSNGHEGQFRIDDIEHLDIADDGECTLCLLDGQKVSVAHIALTGSH